MSGTLPVNTFNKVTIKNNTPTATSISISGRRQSKQLAAQFWTLDCEYAPLDRSESSQVMAFLNQQNNSLSSFDVVLPQYSRPHGTLKTVYPVTASANVAISVSANAAISSQYVNINADVLRPANFTSAGTTATAALAAGDFIKFTNHSKVYQLTQAANIDASGNGNLAIFPGLYSAVTTTTDLTYFDVPFTVFNTEATQEYQMTVGDVTGITLKLHEAL